MKTRKAVLWDLDGTLLPSTRIVYETILEVFQSYALDLPSYQEVHESIGTSLAEVLKLHSKNHPNQDGIEQAFRKAQLKHYKEIILFEGMLEVVAAFHDLGLRQAVVTSRGGDGRGPASAHSIVEKSMMGAYIDAIITIDDVYYAKPHPEGILLALKKLSVEPENAVMIGDNPVDMQAAESAGVHPLGVDHIASSDNIKWLKEAGAKDVSSTPEDLITVVTRQLKLK